MAQGANIPGFWDPGERIPRPDLTQLPRLRFLTTTDFPPFNFVDRKRRLTGFHVDLAREICEELGLLAICQIQALPWDELVPALERGDGEAIIAGLAPTQENRARFEFSRPFLRIPARFVARRADGIGEPLHLSALEKRIGVVAGSSHAQWLREAFSRSQAVEFPNRQAALAALADGGVDLVFSDAISLSFWLVSPDSRDCCAFAGGPYMSDPRISQPLSIAFPKGRTELSGAADHALQQMGIKGRFAEIYLRYFPLGLF